MVDLFFDLENRGKFINLRAIQLQDRCKLILHDILFGILMYYYYMQSRQCFFFLYFNQTIVS
jgi:hypothetical protein